MKHDKTDNDKYCSTSIFPTLSNVNKRLMYNQNYPYFLQNFPNFSMELGKVLMCNTVF